MAKHNTQLEAFLADVSSSNGVKKLLADEGFVNSIATSGPDIEEFFNVVQRDFRSKADDPKEARLEEWAVVRAIGALRDFLLLASMMKKAVYPEVQIPEDDDFDD